MPHVVYLAAFLFCPWPACGYRIELIDFQLEKYGDPSFYANVMRDWGSPNFGLVGRCPGCGNLVQYGLNEKKQMTEAAAMNLPRLDDDWHQHAYLA